MGTYTQAGSVYDIASDVLFVLGVQMYTDKYCNPRASLNGILPSCGNKPGSPGFVRAVNASSGAILWEVETPEPPASASVGDIHSVESISLERRLVVSMGHNCVLNSTSQLWALEPSTGNITWERQGPTLRSQRCAGDAEGAELRRMLQTRPYCEPGSWSHPAIDSRGDIYIGTQGGELQRWSPNSDPTRWWVASATGAPTPAPFNASMGYKYKQGRRGVDACPENYSVISDPDACQLAAETLGLQYDGRWNRNVGLPGSHCNLCGQCRGHLGFPKVRVDNYHEAGSDWICSKEIPPTPSPTPAPTPNADPFVVSKLNTGVAFQDQSIAFGPGVMVATTCTSMMVFKTDGFGPGF